MHLEKTNIYQRRAEVFCDCLKRDYIKAEIDLDAEYFVTEEPVSFREKDRYKFEPAQKGSRWGSDWQCAWFHLTGTIPAEWAGETVAARIDIGGEGLVLSQEGVPLQGVTNNSIFCPAFLREYVPLYDSAPAGKNVELWLDAGACNYFGMEMSNHPRLDAKKPAGKISAHINHLQLCTVNEDIRQLGIDVEIALSLMKTYPKGNYRYRQILMLLCEAVDLYRGNPQNACEVRKFLKEKFFSAGACSSALKVTAVGHAHIDTAWLWPLRETVRKCARTFANQIANIEKYPGYIFGASQPQHYQFVKDRYPELYAKVKKAVAAGRWEPQGGMWVEADCNLPSGESMIRQFLHGKNFFMDEFGFDVKNLWIPDVFGYSGALPQIIKGSGCDYFLTQKISWNLFNEFPHNTFIWRGIDGSEVLTHFPPENNYNAFISPEQLCKAQNNFKEADVLDEFCSLFGIGDGGGGPREDYIERAMRLKDLEGCPKVTMGRADKFFERIKASAEKLEIWDGELYLEKHQGTLTTQAKVKRCNRKLEYLLKHIEFLYSCLPLSDYPAAELNKLWKTLLMNQFHDIIPGSSITRVYKETHQQYAEMFRNCKELLAEAAALLFSPDENSMTLFNPLSCSYNGPVTLPEGWMSAAVNGKTLPGQLEGDRVTVDISIPPCAFLSVNKIGSAAVPATGDGENLVLENAFIRYEFNRDAQLVSVYDKEADYELIKPENPANVISLYHDDPVEYDAWDIDLGYEEQHLENARGATVRKISGPVRQILDFELEISNSKIRQRIILGHGKRLDFETRVQWDEAHKMLRTKFPVKAHATEAAFDIQYGYLKRSTGRNTSWDVARYEVAAHRYADISDSQYGTALLNDCKYGYKVHDRVLDLNLLRSSKYPDFTADLGEHEFTYSLLPHEGDLLQSNVMNNAAILNQPPLRFEGFRAGRTPLPCSLEANDISLEAVKKAEKENCLIIRLVETKGRRSQGALRFHIPVKKLVKTNLIEWTEEGSETASGDILKLELRPFEIRTYKVYC
ncbi:MAG: glycoside hydrolase family 38 C-terminal domain-containing protein [Victivallaceae bacterium]|nr:glycoside hydrolase family 38 C-terminal domain-containing protein [Victivallaceae bacterium]